MYRDRINILAVVAGNEPLMIELQQVVESSSLPHGHVSSGVALDCDIVDNGFQMEFGCFLSDVQNTNMELF